VEHLILRPQRIQPLGQLQEIHNKTHRLHIPRPFQRVEARHTKRQHLIQLALQPVKVQLLVGRLAEAPQHHGLLVKVQLPHTPRLFLPLKLLLLLGQQVEIQRPLSTRAKAQLQRTQLRTRLQKAPRRLGPLVHQLQPVGQQVAPQPLLL
jgi:hypothetical protein